MSKPKVGLVGYFGWGNFGDELFVAAHREFLSDRFDLEVVHDLVEAPYFSRAAEKNLKSFDAFLIGGGDLVNPSVVSPLYWRNDYLDKPVFVYGLGVPQPNRKRSAAINHYKSFFESSSVKLTVMRDVESMRYFNYVMEPSVPAVTFPDAVCAMSMPVVEQKNDGDKILGVSIRSHRSVVGGYEQVRKAADTAREKGYRIRNIVMGTGSIGSADHEITKSFAREDEEIVYSEDLGTICEAIGSCNQLVSMKFHGMIVAALYGVPSLQLSATPKNRNFLRYIQRPDMSSNYSSEELYLQIPRYPVSIHSLLVGKLKRDSRAGYQTLTDSMSKHLL